MPRRSGTLTESEQTLAALLGTFARGRVLKSGAATAIVGAPNAGKSSLLNALVGYDRAIVTDLPGTTRDTVEEKAVVGGVLLRLIDTAGIRETDDAVERLGVERSRRAVESADLVHRGSWTAAIRLLTVEPDILALAAPSGTHWILAISKDESETPAVKTAVWRLPDGAPVPEASGLLLIRVMPGGLDALIDTISRLLSCRRSRGRHAAHQRTAGRGRPTARSNERPCGARGAHRRA